MRPAGQKEGILDPARESTCKSQVANTLEGAPDASHPGKRQNLLHRVARQRYRALGGVWQTVFGWNIRQRGDGHTAFDDTTGEVSGSWVLRRPPASAPGLLLYVMVDSVAATVDLIVANGGEIVQPIGADAPEITARFRDPSGNVVGLYQQPG